MASKTRLARRTYYDDLTGEPLDHDEVESVRALEIEFVRQMGVYSKVPISQCYERTGAKPIGVRWVDVRKMRDISLKAGGERNQPII